MENKEILLVELKKLLNGATAHASLKDAVADLPFHLLGEWAHHLPYSIWQLTEHIRIAQFDMLGFSRDGSYKSPKWPDDYWPQELAPLTACLESLTAKSGRTMCCLKDYY